MSVPDLLEWAKSKRFHLRTAPPLGGYEFVHIETLLCAIERHAMSLTHEQARDIVANDPPLQARMFAGLGLEQGEFDSYLTESPAWLVQADAHLQWRKIFTAAIQAGDLVPLEFGSKLPIDTAPVEDVGALDGDTQDIERIRYEVLASRTQLIDAFSFYGVELKIFKALKDRPRLYAARRVKGQGKKGEVAEPQFCPYEVMNWLIDDGVKDKPKLSSFNAWHILETKFSSVYAEKSMGDPRPN